MKKGVYLLLIRLPRKDSWEVGGTERSFPAGYYAYAGSAMGGLSGRIGRHLRTSHTRHWHVDSQLARGNALDVQVRPTEDKGAECDLARELSVWPGADAVPAFGAADCSCPTHLVRFARRPGQSLLAGRVLPHLDAMFAVMSERYVDHAAQDREPFATLVKCILSLRTQDPVTDEAAERLFARVRTAQEFAAADPDALTTLIYPVGMYRQKALRLKEIAQQLIDRYAGGVPDDIPALLELPGVGRKTANLVRSFAFHKPAICVDTHVHRITNRWGLLRTPTPDETEHELRRVLPERFWMPINGFLVQHGQQICRPRRPRCDSCPIRFGCKYDDLRRERRILDAASDAPPPHPCLNFACGTS